MEALIEPGRLREEAARKDVDRLQGTWSFVAGKREAQLLISGHHFTMKFRTGDIYVGTFTIDPTRKPRAMDLTIDEGPEHHRGKLALAIYEFDGDHLIWCPADPGNAQRPSIFPAGEDINRLCIIFHRDPRI